MIKVVFANSVNLAGDLLMRKHVGFVKMDVLIVQIIEKYAQNVKKGIIF